MANNRDDKQWFKTLSIVLGVTCLGLVVGLVCYITITKTITENCAEGKKTQTNSISLCNGNETRATAPPTQPVTRVTSELYGVLQDSRNVTRYTLRNDRMQVNIINYGGIITEIQVPDKDGKMDDVVLGYDSLQDYVHQNVLFGAVLGRYANLIAGNRFRLDGLEYVDVHDDRGTNESNSRGFSKRLWDSRIEDNTLVLTYNSPDGEGGFPGNVNVSVTYDLSENNKLIITYKATTSKSTVINLTNRSFFNLKGRASGDIKDHVVRIIADHWTPLDIDQVPTGEKASVDWTMYDVRSSTLLGPRLPRVPGDRGFDTNFVFGREGWDKHMASVTHTRSGRTLDVYSTEPGLQFNTGYHLQSIMGKGGVVYKHYGGLSLEAQHYPNSPNEVKLLTVCATASSSDLDTIFMRETSSSLKPYIGDSV